MPCLEEHIVYFLTFYGFQRFTFFVVTFYFLYTALRLYSGANAISWGVLGISIIHHLIPLAEMYQQANISMYVKSASLHS